MESRNGRMIPVADDVLGIAAQLYDIETFTDPPSHLRLRYSEAGEYFVVYLCPDNAPIDTGHLVTTAQELDQRLIERVREISKPDYDYAAELDKRDAAAKKAQDDAFSEKIGEAAERLAHALRKDLGIQKDSARSKKAWAKQ